MSITNSVKWQISALGGAIFLVISSPQMYKLTGFLSNLLKLKIQDDGKPNAAGLLLHTIVYTVIVRATMR